MQFFYVLVEGVKWKIASKLVTSCESHYKRFNYLFNLWTNDGVFKDLYNNKVNNYTNNNTVDNLIIDSTDIINGNCNKSDLGKSLKLSKQAKASFIIDSNKIPLAYSLCNPTIYDSKACYKLILSDDVNKFKNKIYLAGDKGYNMNKEDRDSIKRSKNIILVTPKKIYKKKIYKTKNCKRKVKKIRHTKELKEILNKRIYVEHFNSTIHRSYKRLDKINDKSLKIFKSFMDLALAIIINQKL